MVLSGSDNKSVRRFITQDVLSPWERSICLYITWGQYKITYMIRDTSPLSPHQIFLTMRSILSIKDFCIFFLGLLFLSIKLINHQKYLTLVYKPGIGGG
jgi:hypothetical protein